jgi:hypothetical protein
LQLAITGTIFPKHLIHLFSNKLKYFVDPYQTFFGIFLFPLEEFAPVNPYVAKIDSLLDDKLVIGYIEHFEILIFGWRSEELKCIQGVFVSKISGNAGVYIAKEDSYYGLNSKPVCFYFKNYTGGAFQTCIADPYQKWNLQSKQLYYPQY